MKYRARCHTVIKYAATPVEPGKMENIPEAGKTGPDNG